MRSKGGPAAWYAIASRYCGPKLRSAPLLLPIRCPKGYYNKTTLQELDTEKEILKVFVRQANATEFCDKKGEKRKLLSDHTYGVWAEKLTEIGKLIGGWIQGINKKNE